MQLAPPSWQQAWVTRHLPQLLEALRAPGPGDPQGDLLRCLAALQLLQRTYQALPKEVVAEAVLGRVGGNKVADKCTTTMRAAGLSVSWRS